MAAHPDPCADIACSLDGEGVAERVREWQGVLKHVRAREAVDGGMRLVLSPGAPVGEVAALAVAEHDCCPFFAFALTVDGRGAALEVTAPPDAAELVSTLFGPVD